MARRFDTIVLGVGGMGSASVYHLARRGQRVLGLERFDIPHTMGSSHGVNRIIRLAYYEHPSYVPLLKRAYELWRELERHVGEQLLHITGSLDAGPADSQIFLGSRASCAEHNLPHEELSGAEVNRRFPGYRLPDSHAAILQPEGGYLLSERCIVAHVQAAQALGAEVHARERVLGWEPKQDAIQVTTDHGVYEADRLIVSAGAWVGDLVPGLKPVTSPERQVLAWLQPLRPELFAAERFPVFNLQVDEGHYYGFPVCSVPGFKFGRYHHLDEQVDPETIDREPNLRDEQLLRAFAERYFPDGTGPTMALRACMFTNAPDEHFILDLHPEDSRVVVASPCSGHGFKFCSVVGEIAADLAEAGETRHDIGLFQLSRFTGQPEMQRIRP
ncbi:MAG: N-methyl-L-tryptophan oxidase [Chloroflexota bacterium]